MLNLEKGVFNYKVKVAVNGYFKRNKIALLEK